VALFFIRMEACLATTVARSLAGSFLGPQPVSSSERAIVSSSAGFITF